MTAEAYKTKRSGSRLSYTVLMTAVLCLAFPVHNLLAVDISFVPDIADADEELHRTFGAGTSTTLFSLEGLQDSDAFLDPSDPLFKWGVNTFVSNGINSILEIGPNGAFLNEFQNPALSSITGIAALSDNIHIGYVGVSTEGKDVGGFLNTLTDSFTTTPFPSDPIQISSTLYMGGNLGPYSEGAIYSYFPATDGQVYRLTTAGVFSPGILPGPLTGLRGFDVIVTAGGQAIGAATHSIAGTHFLQTYLFDSLGGTTLTAGPAFNFGTDVDITDLSLYLQGLAGGGSEIRAVVGDGVNELFHLFQITPGAIAVDITINSLGTTDPYTGSGDIVQYLGAGPTPIPEIPGGFMGIFTVILGLGIFWLRFRVNTM